MRSLLLIAFTMLLSVPSFADLIVSPGYVMFGQTKIGTGYNQRMVTVQNRGEATRVDVGGYCQGFNISGHNCYNLTKNGTCSFGISFRPNRTGHHSCSISVRDQRTGRVTYMTATGNGIR